MNAYIKDIFLERAYIIDRIGFAQSLALSVVFCRSLMAIAFPVLLRFTASNQYFVIFIDFYNRHKTIDVSRLTKLS